MNESVERIALANCSLVSLNTSPSSECSVFQGDSKNCSSDAMEERRRRPIDDVAAASEVSPVSGPYALSLRVFVCRDLVHLRAYDIEVLAMRDLGGAWHGR
ncbi:uncharacterized protein LOC123005175 [Tribolium madens]|uniref:uncharacterized protein LOC123005175 n=1 Tax=Tribolium madens TaxID=41895 RepID=UPI001CF726A0|nr:uncharacterized protein LOC123005175 [Tribolium madens]